MQITKLEQLVDMRKDNNRGFTLVELIVVIVILGILSAILVPALLGYIDRSKAAQCEINKNAFRKAVYSIYAENYAKTKSVTDDESFDAYLDSKIGTLYEGATATEGILKYDNVCNQNGIISVKISGYGTTHFEAEIICSFHDEGVALENASSPSVVKTPEQLQQQVITSAWGGDLKHSNDTKKTIGNESYTLGKSIASSKPAFVKEFAKDLGINTEDNLVLITNTSLVYSIKEDGKNIYKISEQIGEEIGKSISSSSTKIISMSSDDKGSTTSKGDERTVTQYLFYETKNSTNETVQKLYGSRIVTLKYTDKTHFNVYDLDGNLIDDKQGLIGWEKPTE